MLQNVLQDCQGSIPGLATRFDLNVSNFQNFHKEFTSCLVVCMNMLAHPLPLPVTQRHMGLKFLPTCYNKDHGSSRAIGRKLCLRRGKTQDYKVKFYCHRKRFSGLTQIYLAVSMLTVDHNCLEKQAAWMLAAKMLHYPIPTVPSFSTLSQSSI